MNSILTHTAHNLLARAHSPNTAHHLFTDRVKNRPLILRPTSPPLPSSSSSSNNNNRQRRRLERLRKREYFLRRRKPRPLSAREKRISGVHDLGRDDGEEMKEGGEGEGKGKGRGLSWAVYEGLNRLWRGYVWEVLGLEKKMMMTTATTTTTTTIEMTGEEATRAKKKSVGIVSAQNDGPLLASLDYHGAEMEVVRCGCVGRVGTKGIVVRDTKFTFVVVTRRDEVKIIPKRNTIFRFEVPLPEQKKEEEEEEEEKACDGQGGKVATTTAEKRPLIFELHGNQFEMRAADRANKKFKWKSMDFV